jgi:glycerol-3-phosphate acyltransferase PlsY
MVMFTGKEATWIIASYALGCFTAAYYWVRYRTGLDVRQMGSGNVGARNAGRILGPSGFMVTFLLDFTKGALAVAGANHFGLSGPAVIASILAVVIGHTWPMQLRFQGGKGIATSFGALLAYDTLAVIILLGVFLVTFAAFRRFVLSGLLAFTIAPLFVFLCGLGNEVTAAISFLAIVILLSHRRNIREEIAGLHHDPRVQDGAVHKDRGTER